MIIDMQPKLISAVWLRSFKASRPRRQVVFLGLPVISSFLMSFFNLINFELPKGNSEGVAVLCGVYILNNNVKSYGCGVGVILLAAHKFLTLFCKICNHLLPHPFYNAFMHKEE